ncbi:hypothetical protein scyTo_0002452, partial [Scyliorhinus torazame]|nr:hypothetical protein [Scyliorhinus torazame]
VTETFLLLKKGKQNLKKVATGEFVTGSARKRKVKHRLGIGNSAAEKLSRWEPGPARKGEDRSKITMN